jgi:HNH endonuclease
MSWNKIELPKSKIIALHREYLKGISLYQLSVNHEINRKVISRLFQEMGFTVRNLTEAVEVKIPTELRSLTRAERQRAWCNTYRKNNRGRINELQNKRRASSLDAARESDRQNYQKHKEWRKAYQRRWNARNKKHIKDHNIRYRAEHHEERLERDRQYHREHREERNRKSREYSTKHRERLNAKQRQYIKEHLAEILIRNRKRHALKRGARGTHTQADIERLFVKQNGKCVYCQTELRRSGKGKFHVDHRMPLKLGGSNFPRNLRLLCPKCNVRKKGLHPRKWKIIFMKRYASRTALD